MSPFEVVMLDVVSYPIPQFVYIISGSDVYVFLLDGAPKTLYPDVCRFGNFL